MPPIGAQGVNIALRDALVAANHLCPVLIAGGDPSALDAAARRIRDERWPEIVAVQQVQQNQARLLFSPDRWSRTRPSRTSHLMSEGVVPVRLVV
jgi:2-polyprenyl-6-methoxyphenol hydroxylase-like FAD-dependent oxidoreductase